MMNISKYLLSLALFASSANASTTLTPENTVTFRGEVSGESVGRAILQIETAGVKSKGEPIYFVLDSPGGSVLAGLDLVTYLKATDHNIVCVVKTAISMAYAILQACPTRSVTEYGITMQHVMSLESGGREPNLLTFVNFIHSIATKLDQEQADRVGVSLKKFRDLTVRDWWSLGKQAKDNNTVDTLETYTCSPALYAKTVVKTAETMFGSVKATFSACPLVGVPLSAEMKLRPGIAHSAESEAAKNAAIDTFSPYSKALESIK